jgi:hypothetical protein
MGWRQVPNDELILVGETAVGQGFRTIEGKEDPLWRLPKEEQKQKQGQKRLT